MRLWRMLTLTVTVLSTILYEGHHLYGQARTCAVMTLQLTRLSAWHPECAPNFAGDVEKPTETAAHTAAGRVQHLCCNGGCSGAKQNDSSRWHDRNQSPRLEGQSQMLGLDAKCSGVANQFLAFIGAHHDRSNHYGLIVLQALSWL